MLTASDRCGRREVYACRGSDGRVASRRFATFFFLSGDISSTMESLDTTNCWHAERFILRAFSHTPREVFAHVPIASDLIAGYEQAYLRCRREVKPNGIAPAGTRQRTPF